MTIEIAAGRVTADMLNAFVPMYEVQGSDQSLTTTPANWNVGALTFGAGEVWECRLYVDYGNFSTATNNMQLVWSTPTGTVVQGRLMVAGPASGSGSVLDTNGSFASRASSTTVSYSGTTSLVNRGCAYQSFVVTGGASGGTLTLTLGMSAGTGTAYAGSYFVAHRVS